jgi:hypothetical protein
MTPAPGPPSRRCVAPLVIVLLASSVAAQRPADPPTFDTIRVAEPPRLEWFVGAPNGSPRAEGAAVTAFRQREPGDGTPVSRATTAFLSYDDDHLYVVFICKDEPAAVRANIARREDIGDDDAVAVYLDTFRDRERAYVFMVNPVGVQLDGIVTEGQSDDYAFDAVWDSEGRLTADGYVVRLAIPFRSLRFPRRPDQTWGIALARLIRRNNEEAYWPHLTKRVQGFVPQFGAIRGLRDVSPGRNVEVRPYGVLANARVLDSDGVAVRNDREQRLGVDAKIVVRDAVTFDATVNPDFSQVESDAPQVIANQRFEVFFPEKRPFFLENAPLFATPINLFFSRRVVDPGVGARVSGKVGRWAVGAIAINDRHAGRFASANPPAGPRAAVGVVRLQREIGQESTVGVLFTDRELAGGSDRAQAIDGRWKVNPNWVASAQLVRTDTRERGGTRIAGSGALAEIRREGRHLEYRGRYVGLTPAFAAPLGFVQRVGIHQTEHEWAYKWRPNGRSIVSFGPAMAALFNWERSGRLQDRELAGSFHVELPRETEVEFSRVELLELFSGLTFRPHATEVSLDSNWLRWLSLEGSYSWGTAVTHDPAPGLAPFLGRARQATMSVTVRPAPRLRVDQAYVASALHSGARRVFTEQRLRTHLTYQFTRFLSVRAIVDYERLMPDATLTDEERERKWSGDILLTYLVNPGTAVHVGYIDQYQDVDIVAGSAFELRRIVRQTTSVGRQVFAKISYLVRF